MRDRSDVTSDDGDLCFGGALLNNGQGARSRSGALSSREEMTDLISTGSFRSVGV
jgi:hypothetical protein